MTSSVEFFRQDPCFPLRRAESADPVFTSVNERALQFIMWGTRKGFGSCRGRRTSYPRSDQIIVMIMMVMLFNSALGQLSWRALVLRGWNCQRHQPS